MIFDDVKVGDQFHDLRGITTITIMELTDRGFKYSCTPWNPYPARYGWNEVTSGELYYKDHPYINWDNHYKKVE